MSLCLFCDHFPLSPLEKSSISRCNRDRFSVLSTIVKSERNVRRCKAAAKTLLRGPSARITSIPPEILALLPLVHHSLVTSRREFLASLDWLLARPLCTAWTATSFRGITSREASTKKAHHRGEYCAAGVIRPIRFERKGEIDTDSAGVLSFRFLSPRFSFASATGH